MYEVYILQNVFYQRYAGRIYTKEVLQDHAFVSLIKGNGSDLLNSDVFAT